MSADFFPTDVRVRIDGSQADGRALAGPARSLLFRALELQAKNGSDDMPVFVTSKVSDNAFISVTLVKGQKIVHITTTSGPIDQPLIDQPEVAAVPLIAPGLSMLSGLVRGGKIVSVTDSDGHTSLTLRDFAPSANCASVHGVPTGYNDNAKLAVPSVVGNSQYVAAQASWYSGAMKRVVQYVQGLGHIVDATPKYVTASGQLIPHAVVQQYNYKWATTHGIYKAGDKNHWLIEISNTRGILAMPLPLVPTLLPDGTSVPIDGITTDTAIVAAIAEFGGIPSGATFPVDAALATAIANGRVLQLLTVGDLDPYYVTNSGTPHTPLYGWAFNSDGSRILHTNWVSKTYDGDPVPSIVGAVWEIALNLTAHDTSVPLGTPVGSGSAALTKLHEGRLTKDAAAHVWVPIDIGDAEKLHPSLAYGAFDELGDTLIYFDEDPYNCVYEGFNAYSTLMHPNAYNDTMGLRWPPGNPRYRDIYDRDASGYGWGCVIHAFYDGDKRHLLRWCPPICIAHGTSFPFQYSRGAFITDDFDYRVIVDGYGGLAPGMDATAMLPGFCREGFAIISISGVTGFFGHIVGVGDFMHDLMPSVYVPQYATTPTWMDIYFGISVNAGPTEAWIATGDPSGILLSSTGLPGQFIYERPEPNQLALPSADATLRPGAATFIGAF